VRKVDALFFMLGWVGPIRIPQKVHQDTLRRSCVLHLVASADHIVHSDAFRTRNDDELFFMLVWDRYGFQKKHAETCCAELVFLHPVGSVGHVVHSGAFRA
jgi:hypothetical protein